MSMESRRAAVAGAGIFGVTAARELRRRGWAVTLVDPGPIPHPHASSTDRSKVIRMDYGSDGLMSELAQEAMTEWDRWNLEAFSRPLFHRTGFLLLSREPLSEGGFEWESLRSLESRGVAVERLDAEALRARFPAWNADRYPEAVLSPTAGWAESGEVVSQLATEAGERGVTLVQDRVVGIVKKGSQVGGLRLEGGATLEADVVVLASGAWTPKLEPETAPVFRAAAMPVLLFRPEDPEPFQPARFPVWGADISGTGWYGFPVGTDGILKIGHHGRGWDGDPSAPGSVPSEWEERARAFLRESLPALASAPLADNRVCFYCDSSDGDFWIARHPDTAGLVVAAGGSGHGFKFGPLLGRWIADTVEGNTSTVPDRFAWRTGSSRGQEHARYTGE